MTAAAADKRIDLIIDFETMGQDASNCSVIDCSVLLFKWDRFLNKPYSFKELSYGAMKFKLDVKSQVKDHGFVVNEDTFKFWQRQNEDVRKLIAPKSTDLTIEKFMAKFIKMLMVSPKISYWWSRSNTFDPIILERIARKTGQFELLNQYLLFWRIRDIRTYIDAKFDFKTKSGFCPIDDELKWDKIFMEHNSAHDVAADVMRLQAIHRAEHDMETVIE